MADNKRFNQDTLVNIYYLEYLPSHEECPCDEYCPCQIVPEDMQNIVSLLQKEFLEEEITLKMWW